MIPTHNPQFCSALRMNRIKRLRLRGFSLLELLVVMGIISVLLGLLIPGLRRSRAAARRGVCASNIRQLVIANGLYAGEHADHLAPGASNFIANLDRWHGQRSSLYEPFAPKGGALSTFLGPDGAVRRCPAFKVVASSTPGLDFEAGCGGYGYNNAYLGVNVDGSDLIGVPIARAAAPDRTVAFTDAAFAVSFPELRVIEYSFAEPPLQRTNLTMLMDPSIHFRHDRTAAVAYLDGHVVNERFGHTKGSLFGVTSAQMEALRIGWFLNENNELFDLN